MHRLHARLAGLSRPATGFVSTPEPMTIGQPNRGRQALAGNFLLGGRLFEAPDTPIWDIAAQAGAAGAGLHGCDWLDDLAAVGDARARALAQTWVQGWIRRHGRGGGPGWTPDLTGRRLIRWIAHAQFLLRGQDKAATDRFYASLARQTIFLSRAWPGAARGLPQFQALAGMIQAGLGLTGMEPHADPAIAALARDCASQIDREGGIPTRNPEELLEVFTLLNWSSLALSEAGRQPPEALMAALARIAPTLRALRHADGGLARFHGGGRGSEGRLDTALAASGIKARPGAGLHMGFARMAAGRTTIIMDAARPPRGANSLAAHAATLAFELTSGRRPLIVNCGAGASFGAEWQRAGRATPSHSTLGIEGFSSSRMAVQSGERLADTPMRVPFELSDLADGHRVEAAHDGWVATHGLTHARTLDLTFDGRGLAGEDLLAAIDGAGRRILAQALAQAQALALAPAPAPAQALASAQARALAPAPARSLPPTKAGGIAFSIRFHLHPEVDVALDMGGAAVSLALKSGEVWIFRHDGVGALRLEPSVYLETGRLRPRACQQIVLAGRAIGPATRLRWSLAKAQDTPNALRDMAAQQTDDDDDLRQGPPS